MRAAILSEPEAPPAPGEFDDPQPRDGQAVVDVLVGGMNPVDLMTAGSAPTPSVAGTEGVGALDGRRVYFGSVVAPFGSFAERAPVDPDAVFDVPDGLDDADAVALGIAGLAAWLPLAHHAELSGGERVLILGATGVAGQIAVQGAKLLGVGHVVAAGRHAETLEPLRDRGADAVAVIGDDPGRAIAAEAGAGYDVVVDYVFGAPFQAALGHTAPGAIAIVVGAGAGMEATIGFGALMGRTLIGHTNQMVGLGVRRDAFAEMAEHVRAGRLHFEVERYPLERVAEAWEAQSCSPHRKLVVAP